VSESAAVPTPTIRCCGLTAPPLTAAAAAELAPLFRALGDPVRLRLLSLIAATDEVCVCDLTESVDVSAPTVSHHLKALRQAGLVHAHRRGTWVYYRAVPAALHRLGALLS
jgi:ArsR family transcriptional regulator